MQPAGTSLPSSAKTVYITITSTVLQDPAADASTASLIHQTKPLDFQAPVRPTKVHESVLEMGVAAFESYNPSVNPSVSALVEATPTKSSSGSTSGPSSSEKFSPESVRERDHVPQIVAGCIAGGVVLTFVILLLYLFWRRRRRADSAARKGEEPAPVDMETVLEEKRKRAEYLGMQRWSRRDTQASMDRYQALRAQLAAKSVAKKEEPVVEEAEGTTFEIQKPQIRPSRARRPSGLAMHPPTPTDSEFMEGDGKDVGRAL
jgi:hypothetical protein